MFGINGPEFMVLLIVAVVVLGPERLPQYAQQLGRVIRELRRMAAGATQQMREELGPEFDEIDWRKLDPRQYDPRRIVREALADSIDLDDPLGLKAMDAATASAPVHRPDSGPAPRADLPPAPRHGDPRDSGDSGDAGGEGRGPAADHAELTMGPGPWTEGAVPVNGARTDDLPFDPDAT